jgi:hypothetical protein
VPDDDLVFDDFRNVKLKSVKLHRLPFFNPKSVQEFEEQAPAERPKQLILNGAYRG